MLDEIFGFGNFVEEIIWKRQTAKKGSQFEKRSYGASTDTIFFYSKSNEYFFKIPKVKLDSKEMNEKFNRLDENGKRFRTDRITLPSSMKRINLTYEYKGFTPENGWMVNKDKLEQMDKEGRLYWTEKGTPYRKYFMDEYEGREVTNLWDDIPFASGGEHMGYPTQKPIALMERIINASSNKGDVVLDAFCGCGTTLVAAQKLNRKWIGVDISPTACRVMAQRLYELFKLREGTDFWVDDLPKTEEDLRILPHFEFQNWAVIALGQLTNMSGIPNKIKSGDFGIDGKLYPV